MGSTSTITTPKDNTKMNAGGQPTMSILPAIANMQSHYKNTLDFFNFTMNVERQYVSKHKMITFTLKYRHMQTTNFGEF